MRQGLGAARTHGRDSFGVDLCVCASLTGLLGVQKGRRSPACRICNPLRICFAFCKKVKVSPWRRLEKSVRAQAAALLSQASRSIGAVWSQLAFKGVGIADDIVVK